MEGIPIILHFFLPNFLIEFCIFPQSLNISLFFYFLINQTQNIFQITFASVAGLGVATAMGINFNAATTQVLIKLILK